MNNIVANENELLGKLNELNNDEENNDAEVEDATKHTTNEMTNKTTNTTNTTNTTIDNSNFLVTMVFDNANQALLQSPQLQRAGQLTTARNNLPKQKNLKLRKDVE